LAKLQSTPSLSMFQTAQQQANSNQAPPTNFQSSSTNSSNTKNNSTISVGSDRVSKMLTDFQTLLNSNTATNTNATTTTTTTTTNATMNSNKQQYQ